MWSSSATATTRAGADLEGDFGFTGCLSCWESMQGVGASGGSGGQRTQQPDEHSTEWAKSYKNTEKNEAQVIPLPANFT